MRRFFCFLFLLGYIGLSAQVPVSYYQSAQNQHGYALRVALHQIIKIHTEQTYSGLWTAFYTTDMRSDGKVWDIYSDNPDGQTPYLYDFGSDQCGNYSSEGDCYNREHSVPKSWFNGATPMYTDLFHIYPTDGWVNNKRGNLPFGEVGNASWTSLNGSKVGSSSVSGYSGQVFEPIDAYKGDLARSFLYMTVCYMDKNFSYEPSMFEGGSLKPWALQMLVRWCDEDPVSQKEIDRNNAIYAIQHNRNPFIDFPELVHMIYGNDTLQPFVTNLTDYALTHCTVYPNPASDYVHVSITDPNSPVICTLMSITGQMLWHADFPAEVETLNIPLQELPSGMYLLHLQDGSYSIMRKIVKR